jgi:hypothetical protein
MLMLPNLRVVAASGIRIPHVDLARVIRLVCEGEWKEQGGSPERLYLRLHPLSLPLDRVALLADATGALLRGGLSPGFSARSGAAGVHLWSPDSHPHDGCLLIADGGTELLGEPSTGSVRSAKSYVEEAGCQISWRPARGVVWMIDIPAKRAGRPPTRLCRTTGGEE